jgi:hypothetical protein
MLMAETYVQMFIFNLPPVHVTRLYTGKSGIFQGLRT